MAACVYCLTAGRREGLAVGGAGVGEVTRMGAHVCRQVARLREGLAAGRAGVGAVAGMGAHVSRQAAAVQCSAFLGRKMPIFGEKIVMFPQRCNC